ncbi:MAG: hypothetical protein KBE09_04725 [Candidatus Pacebacteria bacterium]|nr:hypothetical protein [Candidatus Paceibacterota bacterium]
MKDDIKSQFIVGDEVDQNSIHELAKRTLKYGRVTKGGNVVIDNTRLSKDDTLKLCLVIRFIANALDESISQSVRPVELTNALHERVESVGSRLSRLAKESFVRKTGYGQYSILPYKVEPFLDEMDGKEPVEPRAASVKRSASKSPRKAKELTGVGLDIQKLLDDDFFSTPRFVNEIDAELRKETRYHDPKVIDMTIRKTFVSNRRSLKRIPNTEGGKSKWKYVVRK